jgi:hypothetical protein
MNDVQPFFILANPRSGSSLLRIICESHPNITVPPESGFLEWWYQKYCNWSLDDSKNPEKIEDFYRDFITSKKIETYNFNSLIFKRLIKEKEPKNYSELCSLIYITYGIQNNKKIKCWGDKNNYYIHKTKLLKELYPNAKFIHLVRDGRDVATSYKAIKNIKTNSQYAPKLSDNIQEIAQEWNDNNIKITKFLKTILNDNVLFLKYEDIVSNLEQACNKISRFLNVPFHNDMLEYYKLNKKRQIEPKETLDWKTKTLEKPDDSNIGKYKTILSPKEIKQFNTIAKQSLRAFNYEN